MAVKILPAQQILDALEPEDIFGKDLRDVGELTHAFRVLARAYHPDRATAAKKELHGKVTAKLLTMRELAENKLSRSRYGMPTSAVTLKTPKGEYEVGKKIATGDLCDVFLGQEIKSPFGVKATNGMPVAIKVARNPTDRDLLEGEAKILQALWDSDDFRSGKVTKSHEDGYWPTFVENTSFKDGSVVRPTNIFYVSPGEHYTLEDVMHMFPDGLDMVDASWMLRRLLEGLHWTHKQGYVHGAILPSNILIYPERHGIRILDWCYAVKSGDHIKAAVTDKKEYYAPEVWAKAPADPAVDVYMAARMFKELSKRRMPKTIDSLLKACLISNPRARMTTALDVYQELNVHLLEAYGKPKFRPFKMPPLS